MPQLLLTRSVVIACVAAAVAGRKGVGAALASRNKGATAIRAAFILAAWLLYYSASRHLGLAEMTTLYFTAPVIAVVLAALVLKEPVGPSRWVVVALGFLGAAVAAGPTRGVAPGPALAVLAAAACWAASVILVRWIGRSDSTLTQMLSSNVVFSLCCLPAMPWLWRTPDAFSLALMLGVGGVGSLGQFLLFESYRFAPASAVAPVEYTGLVWAFLYGYVVWSDVPASRVFLGAGLIAASSLLLVVFERRRARRSTAVAGRS